MKLISLIVVFITIVISRSVVVTGNVGDMRFTEKEFSKNYKIISTNNDKLLSNFSFVANKNITLFNSGNSNSIYKPAYTLYYPRTRDEFEVNIYIINFDVTVFASAVAEVYSIIKKYENFIFYTNEDDEGNIIPSVRTSSLNRMFSRADIEDPFSQSFYSVYSFEKMAVIIDAHVQKEYYEKYEEDIKQISENFKFLKPFILENHVEEFKNDTLSYLYPKGWNPTNFVEAINPVNGIRPLSLSLDLYSYNRSFPLFTLFAYNIPFYRWEQVHEQLSLIDMIKNDKDLIVSDNVLKRNQYLNDGEISSWDFLYSWTIKEKNIDMISVVSFVRLKDTSKIAVFIYENVDIESNESIKYADDLFKLSCIGETAEGIIYHTLTHEYEPYFADKFYLE